MEKEKEIYESKMYSELEGSIKRVFGYSKGFKQERLSVKLENITLETIDFVIAEINSHKESMEMGLKRAFKTKKLLEGDIQPNNLGKAG